MEKAEVKIFLRPHQGIFSLLLLLSKWWAGPLTPVSQWLLPVSALRGEPWL